MRHPHFEQSNNAVGGTLGQTMEDKNAFIRKETSLSAKSDNWKNSGQPLKITDF